MIVSVKPISSVMYRNREIKKNKKSSLMILVALALAIVMEFAA